MQAKTRRRGRWSLLNNRGGVCMCAFQGSACELGLGTRSCCGARSGDGVWPTSHSHASPLWCQGHLLWLLKQAVPLLALPGRSPKVGMEVAPTISQPPVPRSCCSPNPSEGPQPWRQVLCLPRLALQSKGLSESRK